MKRTRRLFYALLALLILTVLLGLDLANRGAVWNTFWSLTGEEEPVGQIRGMLEWTGGLLRPQPRTAPLTPIDHTWENPYGINTFLHQEVEIAKREQILRMITDAGFTWIREQFPWADIEIHAKGDFTDRRNEAATGVISAWDKYDNIVALAEQYGVQIQVRLDNPPAWARTQTAGDFAPPDDVQDFIDYAVAIATRYKGRLFYYQVWNEPNIYPEWGEQPVNPEAYTDLLCRTYHALKAVDPNIVVITGALAQTIALDALAPGGRNLNDFIFLQRMYDAGAGECFDILSIQGYGLNSGPTDRRMHPTRTNFSRNLYIREIMVVNGDAHKPIWISEAAWNPVPSESDYPDEIVQRYNFGQVTLDQAARYMPLGYQRAQEEWPWIGVINYWFFKRPADYERNQAFYYFRMVEPDFTPLPIYDSLRQYITTQQPVLHTGVHQAEDWAITCSDDAAQIRLTGAEFGQAVDTLISEFIVYGTDVILRWRDVDGIALLINGDPAPIDLSQSPPDANGWRTAHLPLSTTAAQHTVRLAAFSRWQFDSVTVLNRTFEHLYPPLAVALVLSAFVLWVLGGALRARVRG